MSFLGKIPFLLFGLLFAGVGSFIFYETGWLTLNDWQHMQSWQSGEAQLLSVKGHENDTEAAYSYQVDQILYENDRVYVASFKDNIGSYHSDLQQFLKEKLRRGESVTIWFNPQRPSESVIDRKMRWGMMTLVIVFCSVFIVVGLLVVFAAFKSGETKRTRGSSRVKGFPVQSSLNWQGRKGWESAHIKSSAKSTMGFYWGFAVFWNAVSSPLLFILPEEVAGGNYPALLGLLFPVVGLWLLYKAIRITREYLRFGKVLFEMDPFPGAIGGNIGGRIHVKNWQRKSTAGPIKSKVRLECVHSYVSGSGKNRSRRENIRWAEEGVPAIENYGNGLSLSFRFDVPKDLPQSDVDQSGEYYFWRLTVDAEQSGIRLERQYNIPAIESNARSRYVNHDISAQVEEKRLVQDAEIRDSIAAGDFDLPGLSRSMKYSDLGGELSLAFPMFRNKVLLVFALIFAGGFGFASYSMISEFSGDGFFGYFILLFSLPFILVAFVASLASVYLAFNNLRVSIAQSGITVLRRLLFIPVFYRKFAVSEIAELFLKTSGSTGQGVNKVSHYKIRARLRDGSKITLAEDIDGESTAKHFRDYLVRRLNIPDSF